MHQNPRNDFHTNNLYQKSTKRYSWNECAIYTSGQEFFDYMLGDPEVTEICTVILRDLPYIFAVTSGTPTIYVL